MDEVREASRATRVLFVAAAAVMWGAIVLGSVVCATDSSAACPNWPGCYVGQITPKAELNPILEWVHRLVAISCAPLLLAAGVVGWRSKDPLVKWLPWVSLCGAFIAGVLGMLTVKVGISKGLAAFDLGASLVGLIAITIATVCVLRAPRRVHRGVEQTAGWAAVVALFVFHVSSIIVAGPGSLTRCVSWPVWRTLDVDGAVGAQWLRLVLGAVAVLAVAATVVLAVRDRGTRLPAVVVGVLALVELVMGPTVIAAGAAMTVKAWYAAIAGTILTGTVWIASLATFHKG